MGDCMVAASVSAGDKCIVSINTSSSVESKLVCGENKPFLGATIETATITGYAMSVIHIGAAGKAGYSAALTRKYDCDSDSIRFLCDGHGSSYVAGNVGGLAKIVEVGATTGGMSASAASGPAGLCLSSSQENGLGMNYTGDPISFSTSEDACNMISITVGSVSGAFYLQSFSLDMPSGQVPIASYTLTRVIKRKGG